jgi:hypothetical protein
MTRRNDLSHWTRALIVALAATLTLGSMCSAGDKFGDSTATNSRISSNNSVTLGKYLSAGSAGVLDSMRIWARYYDGGIDTIIACIYNSGGTLLGRSRDSALVTNDNLNPYMLHFDNQTISISGSTRYWIGIQVRGSGSATSGRVGMASSTDSLFLGTDNLPLESSLPSGAKYLGSGFEAIRITAYYSAHSAVRTVTRRRKTEVRADREDDEGRKSDETLSSGVPVGCSRLVGRGVE